MDTEPQDIDIDELIARDLYDPQVPDAAARLESIRFVLELGATVDDLANMHGDTNALTARMRFRGGPGRYTQAEVAERAGLSPEHALKLNRASGFPDPRPDERLFTDEDVELFRLVDAGREFFGEQVMLQQVRVLGSAMSRVADAFISAFATTVGTQSTEREFDLSEMAAANETAVSLLPTALRAMELLLRRHLELKARNALALGEEWEGVDAIDRAVGFCDLVGYTSLSGQLPGTDLASVLEQFEGRANDLIARKGGSVVKLIGDEVMFIAPEVSRAAEIAIALAADFKSRPELPSVRVGLAAGRMITREGDYFGPVVNLAARIVKLAPPGSVVVAASLRGELEGFDIREVGTSTIAGFEEPIELVAITQR